MKIPYATPEIEGSKRSREARDIRHLVAQIERLRPHALSRANDEENDFGPKYPSNFTKGLKHNKFGILEKASEYRAFVKAINSVHESDFDTEVHSSVDDPTFSFECTFKSTGEKPKWRGWESPRAGHVYSLQGPDSGAVGMAPAPRVGSSELAVEMSEVYAMALLRDVPFTDIQRGSKDRIGRKGSAHISSNEVVRVLNEMCFYTVEKDKPLSSNEESISSTPLQNMRGYNQFERRRRLARTGGNKPLTTDTLFRGSTAGALEGPYISQFMLLGNDARAGIKAGGRPSYPGVSSVYELADGYITYGTQIIDQRVVVHKECLDYMTDWPSWLDVQNGANVGGVDQFEEKRRYITTPRDLATYVHYDALYQAYLNAGLIMLADNVPFSKGFPEASPTGRRTAFATFGPPHILSLVTEVATRCLKAVRRQKFNYHRRARPEAIAGRLTLLASGNEIDSKEANPQKKHRLGCAYEAFEKLLADIPDEIKDAVIEHNKEQNANAIASIRGLECKSPALSINDKYNLLLPMAFPEGSPMHPAYGAGHATVAGGCVTILKGFFEMFEDCDSGKLRPFNPRGAANYFVPNASGSALVGKSDVKLTIQGELDKLAANVSIGRNMAGVHYYSDYYDSLRMGERVAVGILLEQAICYGEPLEMTFDSFDGDRIAIYGRGGSCPELIVHDKNGNSIKQEDWWTRHVVGSAIIEDL